MVENLYFFQFSNTFNDEVYLPYSTGLLWAYARTDPRIAERFRNRGFRFMRADPDEIVASVVDPTVAAFSTYTWNWEMSCAVARRLKAKYPECLIVFGGFQVPNDIRGLFDAYPFIDVAVHGEGEVTFVELLLEHIGAKNYAGVPGLSYNDGLGGTVAQPRPRLSDLDVVPSPYLTGVFDELFSSLPYKWQAVWETNRGCPYQCTFCDWGSAIATRLRNFHMDRLAAEIEFFGRKEITLIYAADANYGIVERDLELARLLAETKSRLGFPGKFRVNYAKNSTHRVTEIAKVLHQEQLDKGITLSVQSMDETALQNIKRRNIKIASLSTFIQDYQRFNIPTYTEVMIGLPGETYRSFTQGIDVLVEAGAHDSIYIYRTSILPNTEMNDPAYKALHEIRAIRTPSTLEHGRPGKDGIPEYEQMVFSTKTMPTDDWVRTVLFAWAVQAFHALNLTQVIAICARALTGISYSEFYERLIEFGQAHPGSVVGTEHAAISSQVREVLAGGTWDIVVPEFSDLNWPPEEATYLRISADLPRFYDEIRRFLRTLPGMDIEPDALESLVDYQQAMVVKWDRDGSQTLVLPYSWHSFYKSLLRGERVPVRHGRFEVAITDTLRFGGDRKRYANEIVFWGRRGGRSIYQDVEETVL